MATRFVVSGSDTETALYNDAGPDPIRYNFISNLPATLTSGDKVYIMGGVDSNYKLIRHDVASTHTFNATGAVEINLVGAIINTATNAGLNFGSGMNGSTISGPCTIYDWSIILTNSITTSITFRNICFRKIAVNYFLDGQAATTGTRVFDRCTFDSSGTANNIINALSAGGTAVYVFRNCNFISRHTAAHTLLPNTTTATKIYFQDCLFSFPNVGSAIINITSLFPANVAPSIEFQRCYFTNTFTTKTQTYGAGAVQFSDLESTADDGGEGFLVYTGVSASFVDIDDCNYEYAVGSDILSQNTSRQYTESGTGQFGRFGIKDDALVGARMKYPSVSATKKFVNRLGRVITNAVTPSGTGFTEDTAGFYSLDTTTSTNSGVADDTWELSSYTGLTGAQVKSILVVEKAAPNGAATLLTGTTTVTNGSATVTGSGTAFDTEVSAGQYIRFATNDAYALVSTVDSATQITLSANWTGATDTGKAFVFDKKSAGVGYDDSVSKRTIRVKQSSEVTPTLAQVDSDRNLTPAPGSKVRVEVTVQADLI